MRLLADLVRGRPNALEWNHALVEMLAAQVIAVAAYKGERLDTMGAIQGAVHRAAGYPMLNTFSPDASDNVGEATAKRVASLVGVSTP